MTPRVATPAPRRLDNRRSPCAVGLLRAKRALAELPDGGVLEILTRDRFAPTEIRLWADKDGHAVAAVERRGWWLRRWSRLLVVKGGGEVDYSRASRPRRTGRGP